MLNQPSFGRWLILWACSGVLTNCQETPSDPSEPLQASQWTLRAPDVATVFHGLLTSCDDGSCGDTMRYRYRNGSDWTVEQQGAVGIFNLPRAMGQQIVEVAIQRKSDNTWSPPKIVQSFSWPQVSQIALGDEFVCVKDTQQQLRCTGANEQYQLGFGDMEIRQVALRQEASIVPGLLGLRQISAGSAHACGFSDGGVYCWGSNNGGQLGADNTPNGSQQSARNGLVGALQGVAVVQLALGNDWSAALTQEGRVWLWGSLGEMGRRSAMVLPELESPVRHLAAGAEHMCVLTESLKLYGLGLNLQGQLGVQAPSLTSWQPIALPNNRQVLQVVAGGNNTCLLWDTGQFSCLGDLVNSQPNNATWSTAPLWWPGGDSPAIAIAVAAQHGCVLRVDGQVVCFGHNDFFQLGRSNGQDTILLPDAMGSNLLPIPGVASVVGLSLGGASTCMLLQNNQVACLGRNNVGQLGVGGRDPLQTPQLDQSLQVAPLAEGVTP